VDLKVIHERLVLLLRPQLKFLLDPSEAPAYLKSLAEQVTRKCLSLPIYPELNEEEQDHVVYTLKQAIAEL